MSTPKSKALKVRLGKGRELSIDRGGSGHLGAMYQTNRKGERNHYFMHKGGFKVTHSTGGKNE